MDPKGYAQLEKVKLLVPVIYELAWSSRLTPEKILDALRVDPEFRATVAQKTGINYPSNEVIDLVASMLTWVEELPDRPATTYPNPR